MECHPQERIESLALALTAVKPPSLNVLFLGFLWAMDRIAMYLKWVGLTLFSSSLQVELEAFWNNGAKFPVSPKAGGKRLR